jgi:hypothetical protein
MTRHFDIEFDNGKVFRAKLLDDAAPVTCQQLWDALPLEHELGHGLHSGQVLNVHTPRLQVRRYESPAVTGVVPGQIYLDLRLLNDEIRSGWQEIRIIYGTAQFFTPQLGYVPCNHFADIVDGDLGDLRKIGSAVHGRGYQTVRLCRVE